MFPAVFPKNLMTPNHQPITLLAILIALAVPALAADIEGQWKAEFDTQIGIQKYTYEFTADGDHLVGKATYEHSMGRGTVDLRDIKVTGNDITFVELQSIDGQELRIDYRGKVAGDEIKLTRQVADVATEELVAKRVKPAATKPPADSGAAPTKPKP